MAVESPKKRPWFRFHLLTLIVVTAVAGVLAGDMARGWRRKALNLEIDTRILRMLSNFADALEEYCEEQGHLPFSHLTSGSTAKNRMGDPTGYVSKKAISEHLSRYRQLAPYLEGTGCVMDDYGQKMILTSANPNDFAVRSAGADGIIASPDDLYAYRAFALRSQSRIEAPVLSTFLLSRVPFSLLIVLIAALGALLVRDRAGVEASLACG